MDRQREYDIRLELEGARMSLAIAEAEIERLNAKLKAVERDLLEMECRCFGVSGLSLDQVNEWFNTAARAALGKLAKAL